MIEDIGKAWSVAMSVLATAPLGLWTLLLAFVGSALITQRVKFWLPIEWSKNRRSLITQGVAFWTAVAITLALWPEPIGIIAGGCIGIASPTVYYIGVRIISMRWPWIRDLLSQDVRE